jgi:hypothetical protein
MKSIYYFLLLMTLLLSCSNPSKENGQNIMEEVVIENGPKFSLKELINLSKKDGSLFENYVLEKGYSFNNSSQTDSSISLTYKYSVDEIKNGNLFYISSVVPKLNKKGNNVITWIFLNTKRKKLLDELYLDIKKEAEKEGFKTWNISKYEEITNFFLVKDSLSLEFNVGNPASSKEFFYGVVLSYNK